MWLTKSDWVQSGKGIERYTIKAAFEIMVFGLVWIKACSPIERPSVSYMSTYRGRNAQPLVSRLGLMIFQWQHVLNSNNVSFNNWSLVRFVPTRCRCMKVFCAGMIVTCGSIRERARMLSQWIQICMELKTGIGNLFGFAAIMEGLLMPQVTSEHWWDHCICLYTGHIIQTRMLRRIESICSIT